MIHHNERKVSIKECPPSDLRTMLVGNAASIKRIQDTCWRRGPIYEKIVQDLLQQSEDIRWELISRN